MYREPMEPRRIHGPKNAQGNGQSLNAIHGTIRGFLHDKNAVKCSPVSMEGAPMLSI